MSDAKASHESTTAAELADDVASERMAAYTAKRRKAEIEEEAIDAKLKRIDEDNQRADRAQHTLDSDEEDEKEKYSRLDTKKIEGQESSTIDFDGETKITAFNMREEEDDGHFDSDGNFIFNKEQKDAWLDEIDWARVKTKAGKHWEQVDEEDDDAGDAPLSKEALRELYLKLADVVKPDETIQRTIARLSKSKGLSAAEERKARWAAKKAGKEFDGGADAKLATEITTMADTLVSNGEMEAYSYTHEKLKVLAGKLALPQSSALDMFGDADPTADSAPSTSAQQDSNESSDTVLWEYRIKNDDDDKVFGPFNSEQMQEMKDGGKFEKGGWTRRCGTTTFYSIARTDFELYI